MRRRNVTIAVSAAALLVVAVAAGCGSQGTASPTPQTVVGTLPKQTATVTGNPANGKILFTSQGCASCHTFTPAGSSGTTGPNLDQLADYAKKANQPLASYTSGAITSPPPAYVPPAFKSTLVMPTTYGTTLKPQQIADLVAFLTQKS
jgi:mono/diheme cytochrome c family protein